MGTNYYLIEASKACPTCGHDPTERLHIGKSSVGWTFGLHVMPESGINGLDDWRAKWSQPGARIEDEYGHTIATVKMEDIITARSRERDINKPPSGYASWAEFHIRNHSEPGPFGLLRHRIDGFHCIGHGVGTWDLIAGDFS